MPIRAVHIDLDGVVYRGADVIPGAPEAIATLRAQFPVLFVTNTTKATRAELVEKLAKLGIPATVDDILSAGYVGLLYMKNKKPRATVFLIAEGELDKDMAAAGLHVTRKEEHADFVFVGFDAKTDYKIMNTAMRLIMEGAELIGGHDHRTHPTATGEAFSVGPIVKALEYATGATATIMGKPEASFFKLALGLTKSAPAETLFITDELQTDVRGAQALGIKTVLVETGTNKAADCERLGIHPDHIVASLVTVPALLE